MAKLYIGHRRLFFFVPVEQLMLGVKEREEDIRWLPPLISK